MSVKDIDIRVRVRIEFLETYGCNWPPVMFASWRERWERHGPTPYRDQRGEEQTFCAACGPDLGDVCPDALLILREIGISL